MATPKLDFENMSPEELEKTIKELELREQVLRNLMQNINQGDEGKKVKGMEKAGKQLANMEAELREKALLALIKMRASKRPISRLSRPVSRPLSAPKLSSVIVAPSPPTRPLSSPKLSSVITIPKPNPLPLSPTAPQPTKAELELRQKALQMLLLQRGKIGKTDVKKDQLTNSGKLAVAENEEVSIDIAENEVAVKKEDNTSPLCYTKKISIQRGGETFEIDMVVKNSLPKTTKRVKLDRSKFA